MNSAWTIAVCLLKRVPKKEKKRKEKGKTQNSKCQRQTCIQIHTKPHFEVWSHMLEKITVQQLNPTLYF